MNVVPINKSIEKPLFDVVKTMIDKGYKASTNGTLEKVLTSQDKACLNKQYGFFRSGFFKKIFSMPVSKKLVNEFSKFVNSGKSNENLLLSGFETLLSTFLILKKNECLGTFRQKTSQNPDNFKLIENLAKNPVDKKTFKSISAYKGKACGIGTGFEIQESLREQGKNPDYKISKRIQKHINNISSYIDGQILPESVKLYRGEGCHTNLLNVKLENGETINLGHAMFLAGKTNNKQEISKIIEFVQDHQLTAKIPTFASTTLDKNVAVEFTEKYSIKDKLLWNLDVKPKTKGMFIEGLYTNGHFKGQNEVLLQKGSNIEIKNIDYDYKNGCWTINGTVYN